MSHQYISGKLRKVRGGRKMFVFRVRFNVKGELSLIAANN